LSDRSWLTFGGTKEGIHLAIKAYQKVVNSNIRIYQCSSDEAEMAKYMTNTYLATKVVFCNEMFDLCNKLGVDYNVVRELWIADPRIGGSHTFVYDDNRGFGGSCLPKDISATIHMGKEHSLNMEILQKVLEKNKELRANKDKI
jgi:UDPglucose 6-dehydrogenase